MAIKRKLTSKNPIEINDTGLITTSISFKQYDVGGSVLVLNVLQDNTAIDLSLEKVYLVYKSVNNAGNIVQDIPSFLKLERANNTKSFIKSKDGQAIKTMAVANANGQLEIIIHKDILNLVGTIEAELIITSGLIRVTSQRFTFDIIESILDNSNAPQEPINLEDIEGYTLIDSEGITLTVNKTINYTATEINAILEKAKNTTVDVTKAYVDGELALKVDKVSGKDLSSNDYTTADKNKLASLSNYTHPSTHPASMIAQDSSNRLVTDAEKTTWNNKSNFDGNYNNLTNKPSIPVVDVTKSYVDGELSKKANTSHTHTKNQITDFPTIPSTTSQLVNDSKYTDETWVTNKIAEASLGGGEVDLSGYATTTSLNQGLALKVDKVSGKGLSTNDYTTVEKNKLAGLNNYTHPSTHDASVIVESTTKRFVTDTEKATWNNKSNFDGNYNSLTNKPTIPTVDVTKAYVDSEISKIELTPGPTGAKGDKGDKGDPGDITNVEDEIFYSSSNTTRAKYLEINETNPTKEEVTFEDNVITLVVTNKTGNVTIGLVGTGTVTVGCNGSNQNKTLTATKQDVTVALGNTSSTKKITITNPSNVAELYAIETGSSNIVFKNCNSLTKVVAYNNNIKQLDFTNCPLIKYIHIHNNPIAYSPVNLTNMIKTLGDRNQKDWGSIVINNADTMHAVEYLSLNKGWVFGSVLQYAPNELAKCSYMIQRMGVMDIWESAEYGQGINIALFDAGFSSDLVEVDYSKILLRYNPTGHGAENETPIPTNPSTAGTDTHGNSSLSILCAKGVSMHGIAPKSKYALYKIGADTGLTTSVYTTKCIEHIIKNNLDIDFINRPYAGDKDPSTYRTFLQNLYDKNILLCNAAGNVNLGEVRYPEASSKAVSCNSINKGDYLSFHETFDGIDFLSYEGANSNITSTNYGEFHGTSGACAVFTGAYALLKVIMTKKLGRKPTIEEMTNELKKRTVDIGEDVKKQGYGKIRFMDYNPNPKTVIHTE